MKANNGLKTERNEVNYKTAQLFKRLNRFLCLHSEAAYNQLKYFFAVLERIMTA